MKARNKQNHYRPSYNNNTQGDQSSTLEYLAESDWLELIIHSSKLGVNQFNTMLYLLIRLDYMERYLA